MRRTKNLKLPNGFGSIVFLGENRRNPYGILKTVGFDKKGKQIREYVGYAPTWQKAYEILSNYNNTPFELKNKNVTLEEIYDELLVKMEKEVENEETSESNFSGLKSSYNGHLKILAKRKIMSISRKDVQKIIDDSNLKYTGRNYIKILFKRIIEFANDEYNLNINDDIYTKIDLGVKEKSTKHFPFTREEIHKIEEYAEFDDIAKIVTIYLYSGMRPSEPLQIKTSNVFLDEDYMIGGIKTENSIDRIIPIHSKIKKYIAYFYNPDNEYLINYNNKKMSYDYFKDKFDKLMETFDFEKKHTPHDGRHTFATRADDVDVAIPLNITKRLLGHSLNGDVTNSVYIHNNKDKLKYYIERIFY